MRMIMILRKEAKKDSYYAVYKQQVNVAVSDELYKAFKAKCAADGQSMTAVITHYMLEHVEQQQQQEVIGGR